MRRAKAYSFILALLLLPCLAAGEEAADLNREGTWQMNGQALFAHSDYVNDRNPESRRTVKEGGNITVSFENGAPLSVLGVEWYSLPEEAVIARYGSDGALLGETAAGGVYLTLVPLEEGTKKVSLTAKRGSVSVAEMHFFGEGELPEPYHAFLPTPEKLDYLVVATHPDDDVLYLGAVVPYLGGEEGLQGTIVYMTKPALHARNTEALNGAWEMGLRHMPLFGSMKDVYVRSYKDLYKYVSRNDQLLYLVRLLRRYKPVLVFTHEPEGEYGHYEHRLVSALTEEAVTAAADPDFDLESAETYGVWQVQKLYLHDYEQAAAQYVFDPDRPLESFAGRTAYEICRAAYRKHKTQQSHAFRVNRYGEAKNSFNSFGLAFSAAGEYPVPREGIDPSLFSDYTPAPSPEPSAAPVPEETPAPSPSSVPEETPAPFPSAAPENTPAPSRVPEASPAEPLSGTLFFVRNSVRAFITACGRSFVPCAFGVLALLGAVSALLWRRAWKRSKEEE